MSDCHSEATLYFVFSRNNVENGARMPSRDLSNLSRQSGTDRGAAIYGTCTLAKPLHTYGWEHAMRADRTSATASSPRPQNRATAAASALQACATTVAAPFGWCRRPPTQQVVLRPAVGKHGLDIPRECCTAVSALCNEDDIIMSIAPSRPLWCNQD